MNCILTVFALAMTAPPDALHLRHRWFLALFLVCAAIVLSNGVHYVVFRVLRRKEAQSTTLGWGLQRHLGRPARAVFVLSCLLAVLPSVPEIPFGLAPVLRQGFIMALVVAMGWFAIGLVYVLQEAALRRYDITAEDNIQARRVHTQLQLVRRLLIGFVVILTAGALLWSFDDPRIWHYGSGLLASAGVASLILATAAKSTAANILAGLQIAFTEPIRIDDVVVVQGEWGRIEEITSAYVVIKIWDLRRLVVPLSYFIENSFYNWSRESTDIMGTAFLYVDYSIPVEVLRAQLDVIVHAHPLWDGKVCGPAGDEPFGADDGATVPDEQPQLQPELRPALRRSGEDDGVYPGEVSGGVSDDALCRVEPADRRDEPAARRAGSGKQRRPAAVIALNPRARRASTFRIDVWHLW